MVTYMNNYDYGGIITALLILVNTGGIFRIIYSLFLIMTNSSQHQMEIDRLKKRLRYTILFLLVANSLVALTSVFTNLFG